MLMTEKGSTANERVADALEEISLLYSFEDNPHRSRAYRTAAETIRYLDADISELEDVTVIRGVGRKKKAGKWEGIGPDIESILATGTCERLEGLRAQHGELRDLMRIPGVGPKKASSFMLQGVTTADDVINDVMAGKINDPRIVSGVQSFLNTRTNRMLIDVAWRKGSAVMRSAANRVPPDLLAQDPLIRAGSARRYSETVGDLDVLVVVKDGISHEDRILVAKALSQVGSKCLEMGATDVSVIFKNTQVDFRIVEDRIRGSALLYFTGSKSFNEGMRTAVKARGMKLSYRGLETAGGRVLASRSERDIFRKLGRPWIPPAAREKAEDFVYFKPDLVMPSDVTFEAHCHTNASDGKHSLEAMREAARKHGIRTLAVTDHLRTGFGSARNLTPEKLKAQVAKIRQLNTEEHPVRLLAGAEVDVLANGTFSFGIEPLRGLDWVIASIHQDTAKATNVTERYLMAIRSGVVHCLGHPTGRLIGKREPFKANWPVVFQAAAENGVAIEVNCQPDRLDLKASLLAQAKQFGVRFVVGSDAHSIHGFDFRIFGIAQLQKAGIRRSQMLRRYE